jgi:transposase
MDPKPGATGFIASTRPSDQLAEFAGIVETDPKEDRQLGALAPDRSKRAIAERFGVCYHLRMWNLVKKLGFSHISARPPHPGRADR